MAFASYSTMIIGVQNELYHRYRITNILERIHRIKSEDDIFLVPNKGVFSYMKEILRLLSVIRYNNTLIVNCFIYYIKSLLKEIHKILRKITFFNREYTILLTHTHHI